MTTATTIQLYVTVRAAIIWRTQRVAGIMETTRDVRLTHSSEILEKIRFFFWGKQFT